VGLRELDMLGMETVIWLGAVVVMTDTCAYFTGRSLGGPKLAPKISPKKTWSGLVGGIVGAAIAGAIVATVVDANIVTVTLISGAFAIVAQIGDLAISKAKRAFDVKDSGNVIPGHGGVLDRFDGILSSSLVMALLSLIGGGSPLVWL
jgi:phosphatidate cytidylyltransferase